jgi:5'-nucleotidase
MNVLVVNDDGIDSPGLTALVDALSERADVYVCAPDGQRSGASQSITLRENVYAREAKLKNAVSAMCISGTPTDCTKMGLQFFGEEGAAMDMVFSGINLGGNLGHDTLYSGTVGAAMEAAVSKVRAAAVSVDSHKASHFDYACSLALDALDYSMENLTYDTVVNINVPDLPKDEIKGVKLTRLGQRFYRDSFHEQDDGGFRLSGKTGTLDDPEMLLDSTCVSAGYASVTPLTVDYTSFRMLEPFTGWDIFSK